MRRKPCERALALTRTNITTTGVGVDPPESQADNHLAGGAGLRRRVRHASANDPGENPSHTTPHHHTPDPSPLHVRHARTRTWTCTCLLHSCQAALRRRVRGALGAAAAAAAAAEPRDLHGGVGDAGPQLHALGRTSVRVQALPSAMVAAAGCAMHAQERKG